MRGERAKALWTLVVLILGFMGYYAVGLRGDPDHARALATSFDRGFAFSPCWMFAYGAVYTAFLLPVFVVRCERLFARVCLAFLFALAVSYTIFVAFPVTTKGFRPDVATLDMNRFVEWGAALNFTLDPPMNCFPSLHVALIFLAALCAWKADKPVGVGAFVLAAVISASTLFVKQHYFADVVAGAVLAVVSYALVVRGYDPRGKTELEVRYTRWGVVGYVGVYVFAVVGVLLPMYHFGFMPWKKAAHADGGLANVTSESR